jgi:hypothetical protein
VSLAKHRVSLGWSMQIKRAHRQVRVTVGMVVDVDCVSFD